MNVARDIFQQIGSVSNEFMKDMPEKAEIKFTNQFQGHHDWRDMDGGGWGWDWEECEFNRGYAAFTNAEAADFSVPHRKSWN